MLSRRTTSSCFYAFDPQGSASHRLDSNGTTLSTSTFDSFGSRATNDTSGDPFSGFGGQYGYRSDSESGLLLLGTRYYDPSTGRFVTRDTMSYDGGINQYAYVGNSPIGKSDPLGTAAIIAVWDPGIRLAPHHRFISIPSGCLIVPYRIITSIGSYPGRGGITGGPASIRFPDPILKDPAFPIDGTTARYSTEESNSNPKFEAALCKCIGKALKYGYYWGVVPPDEAITPIVCFNFTWDLWRCAEFELTPKLPRPLPTPSPGIPPYLR